MLTQVLCVLAVALGIVYSADEVDCKYDDECNDGEYTCEDAGCTVDCLGKDCCNDSEFTCDDSCTVKCTNDYSCADSNFYFHSGNVTVECTDTDACTNTYFYGDNSVYVSIDCQGSDACEDAGIVMSDTATFSLECSGDYACNYLYCECASSDCEVGNQVVDCHTEVAQHESARQKMHLGPKSRPRPNRKH